MTVESASYIADLNTALPATSDDPVEGDNHLRLIKTVLKNQFPYLTSAVTATPAEMNKLIGLTGTILTTTTSGTAAPIAYGWINSSGTLQKGSGVSAISKTATGTYRITTTTTLPSSSDFLPLAMARRVDPWCFGYSTYNTSGFYLHAMNPAGTASDIDFFFVCYRMDV